MSAQPTSLLTELSQLFDLNQLGSNISTNFHFIRPWWLLAFLGLFLMLLLLKKMRYYQSPWQRFLPAHLAIALVENSQNKTAHASSPSSQKRYGLKPLIIGTCTILALAGPAWQKLPQPVYQLERGAVVIMDMSYSMFATDVKPNRLTRARYKAIDLLKQINEGDVGLIAYAGDAFIISPLTQDSKNIELLLPSLSPDIMPSYGANALAALTLADKTLKNAGHVSGDIYWFTDDIDTEEMSDIYQWANANRHQVNILGIGSKAGAPITLSSGKLLKDNSGAIVIPKLPESRLSAIAQRSRGVYRTMTNNDSDIKALTAHLTANLTDNLNDKVDVSSKDQPNAPQLMQGDQYQEQGPWLLIIILPLLLTYFRRGSAILAITWLMPLSLLLSLTSISPTSYASEAAASESLAKSVTDPLTNSVGQLWQDLWQTSDQQAQQHFQQQDYQQAAQQFEDSQWQGSAHYKAGDYQQALQAFKQSDSAQALYNQGNALAQLQQLDEAIDAYKKALAKDANLTDAKDNLEKLEALKKQQAQQQQNSEEQPQEGQQEQQDGQQSPKDNQEPTQQNQESDKQGQDAAQADPKTESKTDNAEQNNTEKQQEEQSEQAKQQAQATDDEQQPNDEKSLAQQALDNKAQETEQKHQQLLNKVTDDPYLLLRNKMRLEYQKRQHEGAPQGVTKKW